MAHLPFAALRLAVSIPPARSLAAPRAGSPAIKTAKMGFMNSSFRDAQLAALLATPEKTSAGASAVAQLAGASGSLHCLE